MDAHDAADPCRAFGVDVLDVDGTTVLAVRGELDVVSVPALRRAFGALSGPVMLDLRRVPFIDVAGLRLLLELESESRRDGVDLEIAPGVATKRLLEAAGVSERFTLRLG